MSDDDKREVDVSKIEKFYTGKAGSVERQKGSLWKGEEANRYKYAGILPECINIGCSAIVALRTISQKGIYSFFTECSNCKTYRSNGRDLETKGVIGWKKDYCENRDGNLGFVCPVKIDDLVISEIDEDTLRKWWISCLQFDHIDGNSHNNIPENVMTLCSICHLFKTQMSGDTLRSSYRESYNGRVGEAKRALGEIRLPGVDYSVTSVVSTLEKFYKGEENGNK